jgi:ABC-type multidrug transport system ATPase subunit
LMHRPRVLFLDEPTAGIDPVARRELWDLLFELAATGVTMFVTTHYMDEAERCGTVAYLYMSRLIVSGRPDALKALPEVTPEGMRRIEAACQEGVATLMTSARTLPYVRAVTIFGTSLHLLIDADVSNEKVERDLQAFGIGDVEVSDIEPSLEDVFVRLTETRGKEIDAERPQVMQG